MFRTFNPHQIRKQQDLNGIWQFSPDNGKANSSLKVTVPSCWESYPGYESWRGRASYTRNLDIGGNVRLVFQGVSHTADIYFDSKKVAHHYNAYTPFDVIIPKVDYGRHTITVKADNRYHEHSSLHIPNDYESYGGITRSVVAEAIPDVIIEAVHLNTVRKKDNWELDASIRVRNVATKGHQVKVRLEMEGTDLELAPIALNAKETRILNGCLGNLDVQTYSPQNPVLYYVKTYTYLDGESKPSDDLIERTGFREIAIDGNKIMLNGSPLLVKGFCRHEDHPQFGCSLPLSAMDYDLNQIISLGANAIRTSHYPNDQLFLDLCDEKGILVWEENHARGLSETQMKHPQFRDQCRECIEDMIDAHYNHPSIIIWGILNECASETEFGRSCYAEQFNQIRLLDKTRPVSFASCKFFTDICLDLPDIVSYNMYPGWYHDADTKSYLEKTIDWIQNETEGTGKPFLVTEIGAGGIYGSRSGRQAKWSEERQATILADQLNAVLEHPYCSGVFIWQYCDVRVSEEWFSTRPRAMNNKGIVDEYRRPKLACQVVKEKYTRYKSTE